MTPLLTRIERELSSCTHPVRQAELLAERGCYLARLGDHAQASEIAIQLRKIYGDGRSARASIGLMLLEGLLLFYGNIDYRSRDRILRARTLSDAFNFGEFTRLASAWLAHIEFNNSNFSGMADELKRCARGDHSKASGWQVRFCLVMADAHMLSRQEARAREWYEKARRSAVELGDQATIGALIYNRAAMGLTNLRLCAAEGMFEEAQLQMTSAEVESAYNYSLRAGHTSLTWLLDSCRVRVFMLRGDYRSALLVIEKLTQRGQLKLSFRPHDLLLLVEKAECQSCIDPNAGLETFLRLDPSNCDKLAPDDRFIFLAAYSKLATIFCQYQLAEIYSPKVKIAYEVCTAHLGSLQSELLSVQEGMEHG